MSTEIKVILILFQRNEKLFLQLIDLEYQSQPVDVDRTLEVFDRIMQNDVQLDFKVKVSQRRMEFLEDFGTDIKRSVYFVGYYVLIFL